MLQAANTDVMMCNITTCGGSPDKTPQEFHEATETLDLGPCWDGLSLARGTMRLVPAHLTATSQAFRELNCFWLLLSGFSISSLWVRNSFLRW